MNDTSLERGGREDALGTIVSLAMQHGITPAEIAAAMPAGARQKLDKSSLMSRLFAYLGGLFVLGGVCAAVAMFWDDMNGFQRVLITLGSGFSCYMLAVYAWRSGQWPRAVTPLFVLSAFLQPGGLFVLLIEIFGYSDSGLGAVVVFGVMMLQQALTFYTCRHFVLLFFSVGFAAAFVGSLFNYADMDEEYIIAIIGLGLLVASWWMDQTKWRSMTPFWYFVGGGMWLAGLFQIVERSPAEILFLGVACAMVYASTILYSRVLLLVSCLAVLSYIGYFTAQHFVDSVGWPIMLIIMGGVFFGMSRFALKLSRKISAGHR